MTAFDDGREPDDSFDPLTDILFGAIAVLFVALMTIAPALDGLRSEAAVAASGASPPMVVHEGAPLTLLLATATGIRHGEGAMALAPLDGLADDRGLRARLTAGDRRLALLIEPGGEEAAFVLDPILAAAQVSSLLQLRLATRCSDDAGHVDLHRCLARVAEAVPR